MPPHSLQTNLRLFNVKNATTDGQILFFPHLQILFTKAIV